VCCQNRQRRRFNNLRLADESSANGTRCQNERSCSISFSHSSPLLLDHDTKFDADVLAFLNCTGIKTKRTSVQAPWQNGLAEGWIGSCRRELLDHVIVLNETHLRRLLREYVAYHHEDRIHDSLEKDTPNRRPIERRPSTAAKVLSGGRLGGLHHRYAWCEAA
jgi:hypothetical protein